MVSIVDKELFKESILTLIKKFINSEEEEFYFCNLAYAFAEDALDELGWKDMDCWSINGWEVDYDNKFTKDGKILEISGSMYYGHMYLRKEVWD